jgi:putative Holliday junction resolvase
MPESDHHSRESDNQSRETVRGRIAAIDFGTARIGIALSDPGRSFASPYENYTRRGPQQDARRMRRLVEEEQVVLFVVGLPVHLDGRESASSTQARQFGHWLRETTGVPVDFYDERFTSVEAEQFLLDAKLSRKRRKARIDMLAAQILLSAYLEAKGSSPQGPGPLES